MLVFNCLQMSHLNLCNLKTFNLKTFYEYKLNFRLNFNLKKKSLDDALKISQL